MNRQGNRLHWRLEMFYDSAQGHRDRLLDSTPATEVVCDSQTHASRPTFSSNFRPKSGAREQERAKKEERVIATQIYAN